MQDLGTNLGFLYGRSIWSHWYIQNNRLILTEESYFLLMASMRKLKIKIPLHFTQEFFEEKLSFFISQGDSIISILVYEESEEQFQSIELGLYISAKNTSIVPSDNTFSSYEVEVIKEVRILPGLLTGIAIHSAEEEFGFRYAFENELSNCILLNQENKIARCGPYNIFLLQQNQLKFPSHQQGSKISVLMESLLGFIHHQGLLELLPGGYSPYETQTADEVFLLSDAQGISYVTGIRNKYFPTERSREIVQAWYNSL